MEASARLKVEAEVRKRERFIQQLQEQNQRMDAELTTKRKELQKFLQNLSISSDQVHELERMLNNKENEIKNILRSHQFEIGQIREHASYLENKKLSQQGEIEWLKKQVADLKKQKLEIQKSELDRLVAKAKNKLDTRRQEKIDDLLGAQDELNKNSSNLFVQKQFEKVRGELAKKLSEEEIINILAKQEEV